MAPSAFPSVAIPRKIQNLSGFPVIAPRSTTSEPPGSTVAETKATTKTTHSICSYCRYGISQSITGKTSLGLSFGDP